MINCNHFYLSKITLQVITSQVYCTTIYIHCMANTYNITVQRQYRHLHINIYNFKCPLQLIHIPGYGSYQVKNYLFNLYSVSFLNNWARVIYIASFLNTLSSLDLNICEKKVVGDCEMLVCGSSSVRRIVYGGHSLIKWVSSSTLCIHFLQ